VKKIKSYQNQI